MAKNSFVKGEFKSQDGQKHFSVELSIYHWPLLKTWKSFLCDQWENVFVWLGALGPHSTHSLLLYIVCFSCVIHDLNFLSRYRNPYFAPSNPVSLFHVSMVLWVVVVLIFLFLVFLAALQTKSANTLLLNHVFSMLCLFFKGTDNCCFGKTLTTLSLTPISPVIFMKGFAVFSVSKANSYPASQISHFP